VKPGWISDARHAIIFTEESLRKALDLNPGPNLNLLSPSCLRFFFRHFLPDSHRPLLCRWHMTAKTAEQVSIRGSAHLLALATTGGVHISAAEDTHSLLRFGPKRTFLVVPCALCHASHKLKPGHRSPPSRLSYHVVGKPLELTTYITRDSSGEIIACVDPIINSILM